MSGIPQSRTPFVSAGKEREHNFQPGDNVEVCEGELINLQGKILSVDGNKITIMPKHEDLKVGLLLPSCTCWVKGVTGPWVIWGSCSVLVGLGVCVCLSAVMCTHVDLGVETGV